MSYNNLEIFMIAFGTLKAGARLFNLPTADLRAGCQWLSGRHAEGRP
jgi:hypothetical protein